MRKTAILFLLLCLGFEGLAKDFTLKSPDGKLSSVISVNPDCISYTLSHDSDVLLAPSSIGLYLSPAIGSYKLTGSSRRSIDNSFGTVAYTKAVVRDHCNELTLKFKGFNLVLRAYNEGFAYRFVSNATSLFKVLDEKAEFNFPADYKVWLSYTENKYIPMEDMKAARESQLTTSHEYTYSHIAVSEADGGHIAFLPAVIDVPSGKKMVITETALYDYPGMYLLGADGNFGLKGSFAAYPKESELGGHNMLQMKVKSREDYIARYDRGTEFPWRIIAVSSEDRELLENDLAFILAPEQEPSIDFSFVKPGKVAWDWWNAWNLYGVSFKAGINNETYKYYIDFASDNGIEYVILDEGWAVKYKGDLFDVIPEIDLPMLVDYAAQKNVGIILWAGYYAFEKDMEEVCRRYSEMGIKGFKVDFMDRDDQEMVDFHRRAAEMTARYGLMIDFHGTYKPAGLHRTYPNVVNYEAVHGLEQMKWRSSETDQVTYDVTIPFARMLAGPMDYTQGAMRNAIKSNYYPCRTEPMSQGTRCRQLAEYVVFFAPLTMMCDSPSNYIAEKECTSLISEVPVIWDETRALDGKIGEYVSVARRNGDVWWVGAMTSWEPRTIHIDLSFVPDGNRTITIFQDGENADKAARDYKKTVISMPESKCIDIPLAPGGGCILKIE